MNNEQIKEEVLKGWKGDIDLIDKLLDVAIVKARSAERQKWEKSRQEILDNDDNFLNIQLKEERSRFLQEIEIWNDDMTDKGRRIDSEDIKILKQSIERGEK